MAVVGASRNPRKVGHIILRNILEYGFRGRVYPVNPHASTILGLRAYPSLTSLPETVDVAVVAVPAEKVPRVVQDAGEAGIPFLVIVSSGFREVGRHDLEEEVLRIARKYGVRIIGPNVAGIVYTPARLNATFGPRDVIPGSIAFISQSGAFAIALMGATINEGMGVSAIVSVGNKVDIDDVDLLEYFETDSNTSVVLMYVEGLRDGRRFLRVASKVSLRKPVIIIKAGRTEAGAKAAASHTGSLAGSFDVYRAAFRQSGVLLATSMEEAFDAAKAFAWNPLPRGDRVLVITNGGGAGIQAVDTLVERRIRVEEPPTELQDRMKSFLPNFASTRNPIDLTGMAHADWFYRAIKEAMRHPWVDAIVVLYTQTGLSGPVETAKAILDAIREEGHAKPVTVGLLGGPECIRAARLLTKERVAAYPTPERAANAMSFLVEYVRLRDYVKERLSELQYA
ncbi:CoA-binding domain protein [Pyrolobus fumarii 1A]|uniref:CoA-binding domain protein n=1 Tax=Pyrolobus fumarii (strain DSM 11204 / 1A) TaxID=694429 RepID=G0EH45_PYRF1|nr:CoA-binding protein [Pyrolobus fumarii]AEM39269.1 CoA-binding domain protein [Pyrolobus fumarii 1A]